MHAGQYGGGTSVMVLGETDINVIRGNFTGLHYNDESLVQFVNPLWQLSRMFRCFDKTLHNPIMHKSLLHFAGIQVTD